MTGAEHADRKDAQRMLQCMYRNRDALSATNRHRLNAYEGLSVREAIAADETTNATTVAKETL